MTNIQPNYTIAIESDRGRILRAAQWCERHGDMIGGFPFMDDLEGAGGIHLNLLVPEGTTTDAIQAALREGYRKLDVVRHSVTICPAGYFDPQVNKMLDMLAKSPITPGVYQPSANVKIEHHAAVLLDGKPFLLTGWADDKQSVELAHDLAGSADFNILCSLAGVIGGFSAGVVEGGAVEWMQSHAAIVESKAGRVEEGDQKGLLIAILVADVQGLVEVMCMNEQISSMIGKSLNQNR